MAAPLLPFVPISRQLLDSSVWETDLRVRVLWITMLMIAAEPARRGTVDITVRALSGRAAMSPEDVKFALDVLTSPDPSSRTAGNDGRRIERIDSHREWGWRILNWEAYEKDRERMLGAARAARYRGRIAGAEEDHASRSVTPRHGIVTPCHVEGEVEVEVEGEGEGEHEGGLVPSPTRAHSRKTVKAPGDNGRVPGSLADVAAYWREARLAGGPEPFFDHFTANGWKVGGKAPMRDWRAAARNWSRNEKKFAGAGRDKAGHPTSDLLPISEWGKDRPDAGG